MCGGGSAGVLNSKLGHGFVHDVLHGSLKTMIPLYGCLNLLAHRSCPVIGDNINCRPGVVRSAFQAFVFSFLAHSASEHSFQAPRVQRFRETL